VEYHIKEAAKKVGLPPHTIRYYEQEGLLPFIRRDKNGNRIFNEADLTWIDSIVCFLKTGIALSKLREIGELAKQGEGTATKRKEIFKEHKFELMEKRKDLDKALKKIEEKIEYYEDMESNLLSHN